jgi:salicylate hydroxylase
MMPDQSQGACQAIEDAAALGIVFGKKNFTGNIKEALGVYEEVRKPRATKVQAASAKARENINERIGKQHAAGRRGENHWSNTKWMRAGFSSNTDNPRYSVDDESHKLTIDEMNL